MSWSPTRNKDYYSRDTYYKGECPRFRETATLSIHLSGKIVGKNDKQPTFSPYLQACSLLKEKREKDTSCKLGCSCFEDYKNSHDY